jgi:hypothetical protein
MWNVEARRNDAKLHEHKYTQRTSVAGNHLPPYREGKRDQS